MAKALQQHDWSAGPSAQISDCGRYRYALNRPARADLIEGARPPVAFILLNPSTADGVSDDHTLRKCLGFAWRWGYGDLGIVNLFAWRARDRSALVIAGDPVGNRGEAKLNDRAIIDMAEWAHGRGGIVVAGWGNDGTYLDRAYAVREMISQAGIPLRAIRLTTAGQPEHPCYLPGHLCPEVWG